MSGKVFMDTNVLLYAYDLREKRKHPIALAVFRELVASDLLVVSTQVLGEFYVNAVRAPRGESAMTTHDAAERVVSRLAEGDCYTTTPSDCLQAIRLADKHRLSFWDALIVVAASRAGASRLLSEDLTHGQILEGVRVENPFRA